ncbi:MAG: hypothetical protein SGPRY_004143, partial [Prymnesium sp.]
LLMAARQVKLQSARLNGIMQRWADTATEESHLCRPVVLFLHGWPGSWFNWRHQLKAVHEAGFRGIAPDMRGYGGTDAPSHMADYNIYSISGDVHALMQHIGVKNAALVGHDHGANAGWKLAALYPQSFGCFCALSVPYGGRSNSPPLSKLRAKFGDERDPNQSPRFHYQLHHQLPEAASHYSVDARSALLALLQHSDTTASAPLVDSPQMYVDGIAEPLWKRLPQPRGPPHWLPEADFEYLLSQYASKGFEGGLNWYRVLDIDWHATPQLASRKLAQPVAFIG